MDLPIYRFVLQAQDAAAPMAGVFSDKPNLKPFNAVANRTSLTGGLTTRPSCGAGVVAPQFAADYANPAQIAEGADKAAERR